MRQLIAPRSPKEFVLDVTRSFAYEVHRQPKRIIRGKSELEKIKLTKNLQKALQKLLETMNQLR